MNSDRPIAIRARYVVPVDRPGIRDGVVAIQNNRILGVGSPDAISRQFDPAAELDLGDYALLPGLINAHTHLEFSDLAKPFGHPGIAFTDWIREVMSHRRAIVGNDSQIAATLEKGIVESLDSGVVAIGEIATRSDSSTATDLHITQFFELIGISSSRIEAAKSDADTHLAQTKVGSSYCAALSPHAPYSCHVDLVEHACRSSAVGKFPVAMHLAETLEELQLLSGSRGPMRELLDELGVWEQSAFAHPRAPLDYLRMLAIANRALVVHGNYLTHDEIQFLGERRDNMSVVFCPRTHSFFGHDAYPLQNLLDANVRVAIGTDSRASNPDLSLWNECKHIHESFPAINPMQVIKMATTEGANSLGIQEHFGAISPERLARFAVLPVDNTHSADEIAGSLMLANVDGSLQQTVANFITNRKV